MLVSTFRSPATTATFAETISGSKLLACHFASPTRRFPCPFGLSAPLPDPVRPGFRPLQCFWPVAASPASQTRVSSSLHSPSGLLHPCGSKRSTGLAVRRPAFRTRPIPVAPHSRFLSLVYRLRIIVPGPLRFRRLAVPQTSWNLFHYAPGVVFRQLFFRALFHFSSTSFCHVSRHLARTPRELAVYKTGFAGRVADV